MGVHVVLRRVAPSRRQVWGAGTPGRHVGTTAPRFKGLFLSRHSC